MNRTKTFCEACGFDGIDACGYARHIGSKFHRKHVDEVPEVFSCVKCKFYTLDEKMLTKHMSSKTHARRCVAPEADYTAQMKYRQRKQDEAREEKATEKQWMVDTGINVSRHCDICNITVVRDSEMTKHLSTNKHKKNVILKDNAISTNVTYCDVCDIESPSVTAHVKHLSTAKHVKQVFVKDNISTKDGLNYCIPCDKKFVSLRTCNDHVKCEHKCEPVVVVVVDEPKYTKEQMEILQYHELLNHWSAIHSNICTLKGLRKKQRTLTEEHAKELASLQELLPHASASYLAYGKEHEHVLTDDATDWYFENRPVDEE